MYYLLVACILFYTTTKIDICWACPGIQNVLVEVKDYTGARNPSLLNGCLDWRKFYGTVVTELHIREQIIPSLGRDYITRLVKLNTLEITNCQMESIFPGALTNLPRLRSVEISHNLITKVSQGTFDPIDSIKYIKLNNNKINKIADRALAIVGLIEVNLSHNELTEWTCRWFAVSSKVEVLDFSFNRITTTPREAFDGMLKLREVNLEHNELTSLDGRAFRNIKSLNALNLKSNKLESLDSTIFPTVIKISYLNLAANKIYYLENGILQKLIVNTLVVDYNPWLCPCIWKLEAWINANNVTKQKADNCSVSDFPICLAAEKCQELRDNTPIETYLNLMDSTPKEGCKDL